MIHFCFSKHCFFLIFVINIIIVQMVLCNSSMPNVSQELLSKLYTKYREAVEDDTTISTRRLFTQNRQYKIHVKKLKKVNGFKRHNLMIKEEVKSEKNPLIYINNPVESKFPNAYLTLEEFKQALTNRISTQRETIKKLHLRMPNELKKTRFISNTRAKIITTKPKNHTIPAFIAKLSTNLTLENVTATNINFTNSTKIVSTTSILESSPTSNNIEKLITEPTKVEITESVPSNKDNNISSNVTILREKNEYSTIQYIEPTTLNDISDPTINTDSLNAETDKTETPKINTEVTTKEGTSKKDLSQNMSQTSLHTEDQNEEDVTPDVTETYKIVEENETSSEVVTDTTKMTTRRRTLGRPLVFMGGN